MSKKKLTLGGGCFWCLEAIFNQVRGVLSVCPGYAGGKTKNPTYREVCSGKTEHAEVVDIIFDADKISLEEIFNIFFSIHDPTTKDRQGNDIGPQYRSIIFYRNKKQRVAAENALKTHSNNWKNDIVTKIVPLEEFYEAEHEHLNYYENNPEKGYCQLVINPKVSKFRRKFTEKLKK